MPPQCPVDAIILGKSGLKYPDTKWTHVNSIEEHRSQIQVLKKSAKGAPLASWELETFIVNR